MCRWLFKKRIPRVVGALPGAVRPAYAVGIYSGGSSDGTRISRCPAHSPEDQCRMETPTRPPAGAALSCYDIAAKGCSYFCVYKGLLTLQVCICLFCSNPSSSSTLISNPPRHRAPSSQYRLISVHQTNRQNEVLRSRVCPLRRLRGRCLQGRRVLLVCRSYVRALQRPPLPGFPGPSSTLD